MIQSWLKVGMKYSFKTGEAWMLFHLSTAYFNGMFVLCVVYFIQGGCWMVQKCFFRNTSGTAIHLFCLLAEEEVTMWGSFPTIYPSDSPGSKSSWQRYWEVLRVTTTTRCLRMSSLLGIWKVNCVPEMRQYCWTTGCTVFTQRFLKYTLESERARGRDVWNMNNSFRSIELDKNILVKV